jgi:hypothetical protein
MKNITLYIGIVFFLCNCKKEIGPQNVQEYAKGTGSLIVLNEGNFGFGNASVSIYNLDTKEVFNNQFKAVNGFGIGDVLQSVNRYQDRFYFVVNNSGKVVITDTNLVYQSQITGFNSPRYIEFANGKGFVTDLKQKAIYVVDLVSNQITHQIQTQGWTEQIILHQNKLIVLDRGDYLTNSSPNFIYIINPITLQKEDSIQTGINPNSMVLDKNDKLWILTSGETGIESSKITQYDINTLSSIKTFIFSSSSDTPSRLVINKKKDKLYFLNGSVYEQSVSNVILGPALIFQKSMENFYGLYICMYTNEIYITNAKNYSQTGEVIRMDSLGTVIDNITTGINPQNLF